MEGSRAKWKEKTSMLIIVIMTWIMSFRGVSAANHTVGGVSGWDLASNIQAWTNQTTFHVGDYLVFCYTPVHDVLEVEEEDYQLCDVSDPISTCNDGETVVPLSQEGPRYFICGRQGHCALGLKLEAQVLGVDETRSGSGKGGGRSPATPKTPHHRSPPPNQSRPPPPPLPHDGNDGGDGDYGIEISPIQPNTPPPTDASSASLRMMMPLVTILLVVVVAVIITIRVSLLLLLLIGWL